MSLVPPGKHIFVWKITFPKGQLISEQICGVLNFPKMQQNYR